MAISERRKKEKGKQIRNIRSVARGLLVRLYGGEIWQVKQLNMQG